MFNDMNALTQNEVIIASIVIGAIVSFTLTQTIKAYYRDHHEKQTMYDSDIRILSHVLGFFCTGLSMVGLLIYFNHPVDSVIVFIFSLIIGLATPFLYKVGMSLVRKYKPELADQFSGGK